MCATMKHYTNKDVYCRSDWNGVDESGGLSPADPHRVWGTHDMPLRELLERAINIGATAIVSSGPKSGWYFRRQPKEDIIRKIEENPTMHNAPRRGGGAGAITYLMS